MQSARWNSTYLVSTVFDVPLTSKLMLLSLTVAAVLSSNSVPISKRVTQRSLEYPFVLTK